MTGNNIHKNIGRYPHDKYDGRRGDGKPLSKKFRRIIKRDTECEAQVELASYLQHIWHDDDREDYWMKSYCK